MCTPMPTLPKGGRSRPSIPAGRQSRCLPERAQHPTWKIAPVCVILRGEGVGLACHNVPFTAGCGERLDRALKVLYANPRIDRGGEA